MYSVAKVSKFIANLWAPRLSIKYLLATSSLVAFKADYLQATGVRGSAYRELCRRLYRRDTFRSYITVRGA